MLNRSTLFHQAHQLARRERGMYGMQMTYRGAFVVALRQLYANAREAAKRLDGMASRMTNAATDIIANIRRQRADRIAALKMQVRDMEMQDRLGRAGLNALFAAQNELSRLQRAI